MKKDWTKDLEKARKLLIEGRSAIKEEMSPEEWKVLGETISHWRSGRRSPTLRSISAVAFAIRVDPRALAVALLESNMESQKSHQISPP